MPKGIPGSRQSCSEPDCSHPAVGHGLCRKHYNRERRTGTTADPLPRSRPICLAEDCEEPAHASGACKLHYARLRRRGSIRLPTTEDRFWAKVDKGNGTGCWLWTGAKMPNGYGSFGIGSGPGGTVYPHRFAYQLMVGPIPEGLQIDHLCRVRLCVKAIADEFGSAHLEVVTHRENLMRGNGPAAINARKTHCPQGHEYSEENTVYVTSRQCRTCRNHRRQRGATTS